MLKAIVGIWFATIGLLAVNGVVALADTHETLAGWTLAFLLIGAMCFGLLVSERRR